MSASREKRTRQEQTAQGPNEKKIQQRDQEKKDRARNTLYAAAAAVVVVVVVVLMVWNSNIIQSRSTAVTINGEKYTPADVQFYYTGARQNQMIMAAYGMSSYDYSKSPKDQIYSELNGETWHDYFLTQAVTNLTQDVALAAEAGKAGYTLSAEGQADLDAALASLESAWVTNNYPNRAAYLRANYGASMNYNKYVELMSRAALAADYNSSKSSSFTYDDAQLDGYYQENKDAVDTFVLSQFIFQAVAPEEKDAAGNPVERTEAEQAAAMEEAMAQAKAKAEELESRLKAGEDAEKLSKEYEDDLYGFYVSEELAGSRVNSEYSEWAYHSARRSGDISLVEYPGGSASTYNYCVVRFEDRYQDNTPTANVRHILVGAGSAPTEEEYAQAKTKAEELLEQWKAGGATEDAFAQLARDNSADTGSAADGGLLNVGPSSGYVDTFADWALDASRKTGDTGIVQNTGSSVKGWHIMYYVGQDDPEWRQNAESALRTQDVNQWQTEIFGGYTAENASGLRYVG